LYVRLAHPGVTDPAIGAEGLRPVSAEEIEKWKRNGISVDWKTGPRKI
jgi:hypothetical protein